MLWSLDVDLTESSPWHSHGIFEFALCLGASGRLAVEDGAFALIPGRTILVPPGISHRYLLEAGETARLKIVCINPDDVAMFVSAANIAALDSLGTAGVTVADHGDEARLRSLSGLLANKLGADDPGEELTDWGVMGLLLALHARQRHRSGAGMNSRHAARIDAVVAWINTNAAMPLTLSEVAARFGMSRSLLTREFRCRTGMSLVAYCQARRLQTAARLLASRNLSVTEAAIDSGFANLSHFHRLFKARFGLTPAAFQRKIADDGKIQPGS